ncbi:MAG: ferrous iron transporter B [Methanotrichaceae archaeon]|nr:ferrous iron transporter B [Methanotrichaceae archaeon]
MKRIVLMGNPNIGKSVVFSRLTGADVITSNYPGTTVDFSRGKARLMGEVAELIDAPGTYSLEPSNRAEEVAAEVLNWADLIINVVDATNLERNLFLTLELLEKDRPLIVALNMWDEAGRSGIEIDVKGLEERLQVPVVPTVALTGEGISELVGRMAEARHPAELEARSEEERWMEIGRITKEVQTITHRHPTVWDRIAQASIRPATGIPLALCIILATFWLVRLIGESLIEYIFDPLFELYLPIVTAISDWLGPGFLHDVLIGHLIDGEIDYVQSLGMLTTGLYVPFAMVLPYIVGFYLALSLLEDSGYLPRLATLSDNVFHKLGMHGHGIVPVFLGLGCNVPGILATRNLETRKQRFISATLLGLAVPCTAKTAMIFGVLGPYGMGYLILVFSTLAAVYVAVGLILNHFLKGECPEIFLEIPPYRRPSLSMVLKKTWMRVRWFLSEAIPYLFLGVFLINVLYSLGLLQWLGDVFSPFMESWLGLPGDAVTVLLVGFLRKDLAVGMLLPLGLDAEQLVVATTVLSLYFPCVATFAVLIKELGIVDTLKSTAVMAVTALLVGGAMHMVLMG